MNSKIIKALFISLFASLLIAGSAYRFHYWYHESRYPTSSQAVLKAKLVPITSKIAGTISNVRIQNNEYVKRGDILFEIDLASYQSALAQAEQHLKTTKNEVKTQQNAVTSAQKLVEKRQEELSEVSKQVFKGELDSTAGIKMAEEQLNLALQQLDDSFQALGKQGVARSKIKAAEEALAIAKMNLEYSYVAAPTNGVIYNLNLKTGSTIKAQQDLFFLVENNEWWVNANFKPTALKYVHPKQLATIKLDPTFSNISLNGIVESIDANAVKIKILNPNNGTSLNAGTNCQVTIDTTTKTL